MTGIVNNNESNYMLYMRILTMFIFLFHALLNYLKKSLQR